MQFDLGRLAFTQGTDRLGSLLVIASFVMTAMIAGVVVASGNLTLIGVAAGAIAGLLLLNAVRISIWIVMVVTLLVSGPVMLFLPQFTKLTWLGSMLGFLLMLSAIMHAGTVRHEQRAPLPASIWLAIAFLVYAIASLFYSGGPLEEGVRAIKRHFSIWGLMFALAFVALEGKDVRRIGLFLIGLAAVQVPIALYQRAVLVPMRQNMPKDVVPIDVVAGTFEATMWGGGQSSVMVFLCIGVLALLIALWRDRVIGTFKAMLLLAVVAAPLALGETKIVVVLLPIALAMVYFDLIKVRPFLFISGALVIVALSGGLFLYYSSLALDARPLTLEQRIQENLEYNFGNRGYYRGGASLNRFNAVPYWFEKQSAGQPLQAVFGNGLGSAHGSEGTEVKGHMDKQHAGTVIGLTAASSMLWDLGLVGFGLYLAMLIAAIVAALRLSATSRPGIDRSMCRALAASAGMLLLFVFYGDGLILVTSIQTLMAITLGLIAWRSRQAAPAGAAADPPYRHSRPRGRA